MIDRKENIEPRLSVLEATTETLGKELIQLSSTVKEQGAQLTTAINSLAQSQNNSYRDLSDKLTNVGKTDGTTFWTMIGTIVLLLGAISTPIWINFRSIEADSFKVEKKLDKHDELALEGIRDRAEFRQRLDYLEKLEQRANDQSKVR